MTFKCTDAGRSTSKRPRQTNDCTVRALALASGKAYDETYDYLKMMGRKSHRPFAIAHLLNTQINNHVNILGLRFIRHSFPAVKGQKRMNVGRFLAEYNRERFIIELAKHVVYVADGIYYDDYQYDPSRCVYVAWQVVT